MVKFITPTVILDFDVVQVLPRGDSRELEKQIWCSKISKQIFKKRTGLY